MTYELHLGDCLQVMRGMADKSVDAVVTDPPYNVDFAYAGYDDKRTDYPEWCASWLLELERICDGGIAVSCGVVNLAMWCAIKPPKWVMCWWKPAAMGRSPVGFCNWEPILLYGKSKNRGKTDVVRAPIIVRDDTGNHPCPKPVEWAKGFIDILTKDGMTVFDPFLGSGTTGVAAVQLGRNFIGCEIDPNYFEIAKRRIEAAAAQEVMSL